MLSYAKTVSAKPLPDYKVAVVFNNGQSGIFDCKYLLDYEISAPLADYNLFNQVRVEHGTLCWPNDIDVAPETVWEASEKQYTSELLAV
jgi:hypothetical protein